VICVRRGATVHAAKKGSMVADSAVNDATTRAAVRFFWVWLIGATSVSVAGNVAHAVLTAPSATVQLAAAAAVVPPAVLLGSTHSLSLLVRTRRVGFNYWCALAMTATLAGCAFVLSFDALRDLAVTLGMLPRRAWLWPVAIDVSIANSTLSLLSLAPPRPAPDVGGGAVRPDGLSVRTGAPSSDGSVVGSEGPAASTKGGQRVSAADELRPGPGESMPAGAAERALTAVPDAAGRPAGAPHHQKWRSAADELVRTGVTSKDPEVVAAVLAEHAAGTPTGTISRRHSVHHSTVGRILAGVAGLTG